MHSQPKDRPGDSLALDGPPSQPYGDSDRLVAAQWLWAAELDEFGSLRLNSDCGNQGGHIICVQSVALGGDILLFY